VGSCWGCCCAAAAAVVDVVDIRRRRTVDAAAVEGALCIAATAGRSNGARLRIRFMVWPTTVGGGVGNCKVLCRCSGKVEGVPLEHFSRAAMAWRPQLSNPYRRRVTVKHSYFSQKCALAYSDNVNFGVNIKNTHRRMPKPNSVINVQSQTTTASEVHGMNNQKISMKRNAHPSTVCMSQQCVYKSQEAPQRNRLKKTRHQRIGI
jgi:hypothetical protein